MWGPVDATRLWPDVGLAADGRNDGPAKGPRQQPAGLHGRPARRGDPARAPVPWRLLPVRLERRVAVLRALGLLHLPQSVASPGARPLFDLRLLLRRLPR